MVFSLQYESQDLMAAHLQFRFAFPDAWNPFLGQAEELQREALERTRIASVGPVVSSELQSQGLRTDIFPANGAYFMKPLIAAMRKGRFQGREGGAPLGWDTAFGGQRLYRLRLAPVPGSWLLPNYGRERSIR